MAAKQSSETRHAIMLYKSGKSVYESARIAGIFPTTLYRCLDKLGLKKITMKKRT